MFIAMNRFKVKKGSERDFEQVWLNRDTQLNKVPGFVEFPHKRKSSSHPAMATPIGHGFVARIEDREPSLFELLRDSLGIGEPHEDKVFTILEDPRILSSHRKCVLHGVLPGPLIVGTDAQVGQTARSRINPPGCR